MGSQALEILRQGVWASATGGWFYDPHQSVFCNTAHLYIWLFLLCLPFTVYLYFPPSISGWCVYCGLVTLLFCLIKLFNFALHHMYDTSECVIIPPDNTAPPEKRRTQKANKDTEGIELQMLSGGRVTVVRTQSDDESVTSIDFHKPTNSTIDLKVDVHRKNSSESSADEGATFRNTANPSTDLVQQCESAEAANMPGTSSGSSRTRLRTQATNRWWAKRNRDGIPPFKIDELTSDDALRMEICSKTEDAVAVNIDDIEGMTDSTKTIKPMRKNPYYNQDNFNSEHFLSKFARQLSADSRDNSEMSINAFQVSPVKKKVPISSQHHYFNIYPVESCTKSTIALAQPSQSQSSSMRRNSNSTMSTIQLPLNSLSAQLVSHARRHSNVTNASFGFLPTGSLELGAYMLEKGSSSEATCNKNKSIAESRMPGVRRIKSAALEIGCLPPSVSNLSPHPNSVETIGGQVLKNPKSAIIPPPSKSLIRNPHLNLWPKNSASSIDPGMPCMNYGSEIVYPIAEISDEMQTSQCQESDLESLSSHCGSDYDEDNAMGMKHHLRGFDSEFNHPLEVNSSDTEYENNGSRSPLLDRSDCLNDIKIVKAKSDKCDSDHKRQLIHKNNSFTADSKSCDKLRFDRNKKLLKNNSFNATTTVMTEEDGNQAAGCGSVSNGDCERIFDNSDVVSTSKNYKKCSKAKSLEPSDYFDKTSASSKDFLIEKSSVDSNECLLENFERHKEKMDSEKDVKKLTDLEISNSSGSLEMQDARQDVATETSEISDQKTTSESQSKDDSDSKFCDENSLFGITWLFDESNHQSDSSSKGLECNESSEKPSCSNTELEVVNQKNLGAIPKQLKNLSRNRASSLKENKKKEKAREKEKQGEIKINDGDIQINDGEIQINLEKVETLVKELLASSKMSPFAKDPNYRQPDRKKSIEEVAQTLIPTSMPLLAAFLNSRSDFPHVPIYLPGETDPGPSTFVESTTELKRTKPLMDRNHQKRVRNLKRPIRRRSDEQSHNRKMREDSVNYEDQSNNVHLATSFEDTTDGAIHYFLDEEGKYVSYTFDKNSSGLANECISQKPTEIVECDNELSTMIESCHSVGSSLVDDMDISNKIKNSDSIDQAATNSNSPSNEGSNNPLLSSNNNSTNMLPISSLKNKSVYVMEPLLLQTQPKSPGLGLTNSERELSMMASPNMQMSFLNPYLPNEHVTGSVGDVSMSRNKFKTTDSTEITNESHPTMYYKFNIFKCWQIKVTVDRLKLMALFDRNLTLKETFLSIVLGIMVAVLGAVVLHLEFYKDICAFWFCFVMAGSQYSLLKSVQPDSASPVHGFNRMVAFSRPVYFCLYTTLLCIIHFSLEGYENDDTDEFTLYGMQVKPKEILMVMQNVISVFLLFFPLAFSFGLFPQVNTFSMYLFEQFDLHIFGGNATASLTASLYCVFRSLMAIAVLYGFAYGGLTESKGSQHILFSIFCGLVVPISYHLSRCASDYAMVWNIVKNHLIPSDVYSVHSRRNSRIEEKQDVQSDKTSKTKHDSESNISKPPSIGSSMSKINVSSDTNVSKSQKRSQTSVNSSVNSLKTDSRGGVNLHSSGSIKMDLPTDDSKSEMKPKVNDDPNEDEMEDPLPKKLQETVYARFKNDVIVCGFMALFIFGIHCTTVFSTLQPELNPIIWSIAGALGWILHYLVPQLRKQLPWLWLSTPVLKSKEHNEFEVREPAKVMWFEKGYVYLCFIERNILYPVVFISAVTQDSPQIILKFGPGLGALIVCICALKSLRNAYSDPDSQYLILLFAVLLFRLDYHWASETFLIDYFVMGIVFNKVYEFLLKIQFVVTYIAPWQITWGSAFHAFAQPFSVPHSAMLFLQAAISAILSTPLNPILGSAIFISSYVRPVKFWERDYNTKRVDQSNTKLFSQLERNLGADDNNLNSLFYEHLTRSLQHYLCGDLMFGRWGQVQQGDCFVLASDYLNCLVHIVEMGNGLVSFQLRGLEFRGTYCQQREVEAITEGPEDNDGCCCCAVGHLPQMLSVNAMFSLRWLAWQLTTARYVLEGYSISDNNALSMFQVFDFRKVLITYYVKSIIFYTIQSPKLEEWLSSPSIQEALKPTLDRNFIDLDPIFNLNLDEDYEYRATGITRASFCSVYHAWISHCGMRRDDLYKQKGDKLIARDSPLVSLCFGLSLVGRRTLGTASHNTVSSVEFFLSGLHVLFKGDFRITCVRDEWVFSDVSLLHSVLAPAVRMALKLHQDHFMSPEEYCSCPALYSAISLHSSFLVICHEASPTWRNNVLRGAPHLLALRHVMDDGNDEYKIIMLNKRYLSFRVIKLNRECVRGLWAGQQQELIYLRNINPERGSIQNAKQALRNIINSSCDQPIGYPIYVSPLTTSYAETNQQLTSVIGGSLSLGTIKKHALGIWRKMRRRCGEGCSSGSGSNAIECGNNTTTAHLNQTPHHTLDLSRTSLAGTRGSLASVGKPGSSTLVSLVGLLGSREQQLAPVALQAPIDVPLTGQRHLYERQESESVYTTIRESGEKNTAPSDDCPPPVAPRNPATIRRGSSWRHGSVSSHYSRDSRQNLSIRDRARDGARRSKRDRERDRIRPSSFRLMNSQEINGSKGATATNEGYEMNSFKGDKSKDHSKERDKPSGSKEFKKEHRSSSSKMATASGTNFPTPESSLEDLSCNPPEGCQIIINRNTSKHSNSFDQPKESHKRRSSDFACTSSLGGKHHNSEKSIDNISRDLTLKSTESSSEHSVFKRTGENPRELTKTPKDSRLDRENYRDIPGKYSELSIKETGLRIAVDPKERKPIVKRSESLKSELKNHVSVGCKVVITDPAGVYDCINLGRRIDVTWPSPYQRRRGGRNSWGTWVPLQGMDGQVVHKWTPNHRDPNLRSHVDKTILLVQIGDRFVPIAENCVQDLGDEV